MANAVKNSRGRRGSDDPAGLAPDGSIKSVVLTFRIIDELAAAREPTGVSELARRLGEAKARIHRHLLTLRKLGVLSQDTADRYMLAWKLFQLGQAAASQSGLKSIADAPMRRLRDATKLTAILALPAGDEVIVAHTVESESEIAVTVRQGLRMPAHGSAFGRLMLAFAPPEFAARILSRPLRKLTPDTLTDRDALAFRLARGRAELFDATNNETAFGTNTIAAPVLDHGDALVAAVGVIGTQVQVVHPPAPELVDAVRACAAGISARLGSEIWARASHALPAKQATAGPAETLGRDQAK